MSSPRFSIGLVRHPLRPAVRSLPSSARLHPVDLVTGAPLLHRPSARVLYCALPPAPAPARRTPPLPRACSTTPSTARVQGRDLRVGAAPAGMFVPVKKEGFKWQKQP